MKALEKIDFTEIFAQMNFTDSQARSLQRFAHHAGRGIHRFNMIGPGDRVLIGVSGGKDSLALSLALVERKKWVPIDYELFAVHIEWREHPWRNQRSAAWTTSMRSWEFPCTGSRHPSVRRRSKRSSAATRAHATGRGFCSTRRSASGPRGSPWGIILTTSPAQP